jgi:hypothetical protein
VIQTQETECTDGPKLIIQGDNITSAFQDTVPVVLINEGEIRTAQKAIAFLRAGCPAVQILVEDGYEDVLNKTKNIIQLLQWRGEVFAFYNKANVFAKVVEVTRQTE